MDAAVDRRSRPDMSISASSEMLTPPRREKIDNVGTRAAPHMAAPSLWRHRDFLLLWGGQSVSRIGDQFTGLAVPYMAAYILGASPAEMGLLGAAGTVPFLLFGLLVGVWVDRRQRRSVLILAYLGRGAMIATIAFLGIVGLARLMVLPADEEDLMLQFLLKPDIMKRIRSVPIKSFRHRSPRYA